MTGYVIIRTDGKYLARLGAKKAYTCVLEKARVFATYENASYEKCPENESVVSLLTLLPITD